MKAKFKLMRSLLLLVAALSLFKLMPLQAGQAQEMEAWTFEEAVEILETSFNATAPDDIHLLREYENRIVLRSKGNSLEFERLPDHTVITAYMGEGNYDGLPSVLHVVQNDNFQIIGERHYNYLSETGYLEPFDLDSAGKYIIDSKFVFDSEKIEVGEHTVNDGSIELELISDDESEPIGRYKLYPNGFIEYTNLDFEAVPLYEFTSNGMLDERQLLYFETNLAKYGAQTDEVYIRYYPNTNRHLLHVGVPLGELLENGIVEGTEGTLGFEESADYQIYVIYSTYNFYQPEDDVETYLFTVHDDLPVTLVVDQTDGEAPFVFRETDNQDIAEIFENIIGTNGYIEAPWTQEKLEVLDAFIGKWQDEMGQYYDQFFPDRSLEFSQGGADLDFFLDLQIDGQRYSAEFSENGLGSSDFNVVAVYSDLNDPNSHWAAYKTYFFAFTADGTPVVLFTDQREGGAPARFNLTENTDLRDAFDEIGSGN